MKHGWKQKIQLLHCCTKVLIAGNLSYPGQIHEETLGSSTAEVCHVHGLAQERGICMKPSDDIVLIL